MFPAILAIDMGLIGALLLLARVPDYRFRTLGFGLCAVGVSMLSSLAIEHRSIQSPELFVSTASASEFAPAVYVGLAGEKVYHRLDGCLAGQHDVRYRCREEAEWAYKEPCTECLAHQARQHIANYREDNESADTR